MKKYNKVFLGFVVMVVFACSYLPQEYDIDSTLNYEETTENIKLNLVSYESDITLVFLPGGLVDPHAYLNLMQRIALDSVNVVILKFTANLGILELPVYDKIRNLVLDASSVYLAGHSLGGITALSAVKEMPTAFDGLILLGTYPSESFAIPDWDRSVLSIYAENDSLSTPTEVLDASAFLPEKVLLDDINSLDTILTTSSMTFYHMIQGGNHAQFGDYGAQDGDGVASISGEVQHQQIHEAILEFIAWNEGE